MNYGLIGEHLVHSFSKEIHSYLGDYDFILKEISKDKIDSFFKNKEFKAICVTIPYKEKAIEYMDYLSDDVRKIGALNTVVNRDGKLYGYNTDFYGLRALIIKNGIEIKNKKVLILGNGGTSKTAFAVCESLAAKQILKVSRSSNKNTISYEEAVNKHSDAQILINTTPCGMYPDVETSAVDPRAFKKLEGCIDVVYNPLETEFIRLARETDAKTCTGLYMLVAQAVFAYKYFFDTEISSEIINDVYIKILKKKLNIVLIGMPSSGKTTNGRLIADYLSLPFYDTDSIIEKNEKLTVKEIFEKYNEEYFRKSESEVIKKISLLSGCVISTGGGAVLNDENLRFLKKNGIAFFIDRPLNKLICTDSRPLSDNKENLKNIYEQRYDIYKRSADYILKSDDTFKEFCTIYKEIFN